jgi:hypothetical protein
LLQREHESRHFAYPRLVPEPGRHWQAHVAAQVSEAAGPRKDREEFIRALQERIDAKDQAKLKGGPYSRYILVVHTDEMFLAATQIEQWLAGAAFRASRITDILLGLSYDPANKGCPVFRLPVAE